MRFVNLAATSLALTICAAPGFATAAIYKCPGPGGQVQFSDKPCGGALEAGEHEVEVEATQIGGSFATKEQIQQQKERAQRAVPRAAAGSSRRSSCKSYSSTALRSIVVSRGVEPGMSAGAVRQSWGSPTVINGGDPEQWVYRWRDRTSYVYFVGGCVWQVDGGYGG